jgi:AcrR family transcriptional regulator
MKKRGPPSKTAKQSNQPAVTLLDAARSIFVSEGLRGLSMRRVAQEAGCTTMAVYTQFGGKPGIVAALFDEGFEQLAQAQSLAMDEPDPKLQVIQLCRAYRETALKFPHHYALMLGRFSGDFSPSEDSAMRALATFTTLVQATTRLLEASGPVSKVRKASKTSIDEDAQRIASTLFALCHGWVSLEQAGMLPDSAEKDTHAFDLAIEAFVNSVA